MVSSLLAALKTVPQSTTSPSRLDDIPEVFSAEEEEEEPTRGGGAAVRRLHLEETAYDPPTGLHHLFTLRSGGCSHSGMKRPNNEDAMLLLDDEGLYVVADGMGGYHGGEIASRLAVDAMATTYIEENHLHSAISNLPPRAVHLVQSFAAANEAVRCAAAQNRVLAEMGTTVVAAHFLPRKGRIYVGHVGDSRCYRLRSGTLERITRDHTMGELGFAGREGQRLSRAVGSNGIVEADVAILEPHHGDVFLLCSDGINKTLSDDTIRGVLETIRDPELAATELVTIANARGARDNVTAIVVCVQKMPPSVSPRSTR